MAQKTDYSPYNEAAGEAERRRRMRLLPALLFPWSFLVFALAVAGIVILVIWLLGGFGEGAESFA